MKLLLVEDEESLASVIIRILSEANHLVIWAPDGEIGVQEAKGDDFSLIILDVLMPKKNGWQVLEEIRQARITTPVLMLTAMDSVSDKVKGLEAGADDYLAKPFDMLELIARVNALLRRDKIIKGQHINISDLSIDRKSRTVTRDGKPIQLTRREYDLLEALAINEGRVLSRETIQERVWGDEESSSNTVDVFIGTLRKKIDVPFGRKLIHTSIGFGYVLKADETS